MWPSSNQSATSATADTPQPAAFFGVRRPASWPVLRYAVRKRHGFSGAAPEDLVGNRYQIAQGTELTIPELIFPNNKVKRDWRRQNKFYWGLFGNSSHLEWSQSLQWMRAPEKQKVEKLLRDHEMLRKPRKKQIQTHIKLTVKTAVSKQSMCSRCRRPLPRRGVNMQICIYVL